MAARQLRHTLHNLVEQSTNVENEEVPGKKLISERVKSGAQTSSAGPSRVAPTAAAAAAADSKGSKYANVAGEAASSKQLWPPRVYVSGGPTKQGISSTYTDELDDTEQQKSKRVNRVAPLSVNTEASATGDDNDRLLMSQNSGYEEYATIGGNKSIYARRPGASRGNSNRRNGGDISDKVQAALLSASGITEGGGVGGRLDAERKPRSGHARPDNVRKENVKRRFEQSYSHVTRSVRNSMFTGVRATFHSPRVPCLNEHHSNLIWYMYEYGIQYYTHYRIKKTRQRVQSTLTPYTQWAQWAQWAQWVASRCSASRATRRTRR